MKWLDNFRARLKCITSGHENFPQALKQANEHERIEVSFQETMEKVMALLNLMKGFKLNEYDIIREFFRNSAPFAEYHGRQTLLVKKSDLKQLNILWKRYRN